MNNVRVCMCDCSNKSKSARAECRAKLAWALLRRSRFSRQRLKEREAAFRDKVSMSAVNTTFPFVDSAKICIKTHPMKQSFIGREFVKVLAGVLPFSALLVKVLGDFSAFW